MATCFLDQTAMDKLVRLDREDLKECQQIPWSKVHWIYLKVQAKRYRAMVDVQENIQEMLWVHDILYKHEHLLWFGILCHDRSSLGQMIQAYNSVQTQGVLYLHQLWEHFHAPETPTDQLQAEFHPQLAGSNTPIRNATEYARRVQQIEPGTVDHHAGLQSAFANVSAAPTVVYSWDRPGAFAPSE